MDEKPKNKYWRFLAGFLAMIVGVVVLFGVVSPWIQNKEKPPSPKPDEIVVTKLPNGDQLVENRTQGYKATLPATWYVDQTRSVGSVLYPDYNPENKNTANCKIELSTLSNKKGLGLDEWLTYYLHQDPTANIKESSRKTFSIGNRSGLQWLGEIDNVTTFLIYVSAGSKVYEIAPSSLQDNNVIKECGDKINYFLSNLSL